MIFVVQLWYANLKKIKLYKYVWLSWKVNEIKYFDIAYFTYSLKNNGRLYNNITHSLQLGTIDGFERLANIKINILYALENAYI